MFFIPDLGAIAVAGPLTNSIRGAQAGGKAPSIEAALTENGFTAIVAFQCGSALKAQKYALIVHGNAEEASQVDLFLAGHRASTIDASEGRRPFTMSRDGRHAHAELA